MNTLNRKQFRTMAIIYRKITEVHYLTFVIIICIWVFLWKGDNTISRHYCQSYIYVYNIMRSCQYFMVSWSTFYEYDQDARTLEQIRVVYQLIFAIKLKWYGQCYPNLCCICVQSLKNVLFNQDNILYLDNAINLK